jgi:hypothetical protein
MEGFSGFCKKDRSTTWQHVFSSWAEIQGKRGIFLLQATTLNPGLSGIKIYLSGLFSKFRIIEY